MEKVTVAQQKIVDQLQRGDRKRIADDLGITPWGVSRVLKGDYKNDAVWKKAIEIVKEHQAVQTETIKVAESLH